MSILSENYCKSMTLKQKHIYYTGTENNIMMKIHGYEVNLSWLAIISTITSVTANIMNISWIMKPFQKHVKTWVVKLSVIPMFLFRMISWVVIVASLKSFASPVLIIMATVNMGILFGKSDQLFETAMLSIVFPAFKFPTTETPNHVALKVFFLLSIIGNVNLMASLVTVYFLNWTSVMNPWCSLDHVLVPEEMLTHVCLLMLTLFCSSTLTTIVLKVVKKPR